MSEIYIEEKLKGYKEEISERFCKMKDECRICQDNYIGTISFNNNKFTWNNDENYILKEKRNNNYIKICEKNNERIVIVLESPHIEEYSTNEPMPAIGETGKALNEHLIDILNEKSIDEIGEKFDIILMNAIQYQTSLGYNTEIFRDRIWLKMWIELGEREKFIERLEKYNPDIILNLCTKGSHKYDLVYKSDKSSYMTSIRCDYIEQLNIEGVSLKDGDILKNGEVISNPDYISKNNNNKAFKYTLSKFVDNAIKAANVGKIIIGPHPASWKRLKNSNEINFIELFH